MGIQKLKILIQTCPFTLIFFEHLPYNILFVGALLHAYMHLFNPSLN